MMYGQMTAGSWIYIGSQGIVQGTYETFVEAGPPALRRRPRRAAGSSPPGLGGMGGAQPLAATFAGAVLAEHRVPADRASTSACAPRYLDEQASDLDDALAPIARHTAAKRGGLDRPARQRRRDPARAGARAQAGGIRPDLVTDQTSAHDLVNGYLPAGWSVEQWQAAQADPSQHAALREAAGEALRRRTCRRCSTSRRWACRRSTTATTSARSRSTTASANAFDFPGFVPAYIRPLFCRGKGPFRWVALSGDPEDIRKTDAKMKELFPDRRAPAPLARHGRRAHRLPGPAGADLLDRPGRAPPRRPGVQRDGEVAAS